MHKAREKHHRQRCPVILEEDSDLMSKKTAISQLATDISNDEDQKCHHDGEVEGFFVTKEVEDLHSFFEVDAGYVEAEDVAGETGNVA
jgi:hypothetical protein